MVNEEEYKKILENISNMFVEKGLTIPECLHILCELQINLYVNMMEKVVVGVQNDKSGTVIDERGDK